jgi:hypothetical protein
MAGFDLSKIKSALERIPRELDGKTVKAGFGLLGDAAYKDGTPVAAVAAIQEYGAPARGIPPRPFMRTAIKEHQAEWNKTLADGAKAVLHGQATGHQVLEGVGLQMQGDIKLEVNGVESPPLSPVTLLLRQWRKEGRKITGKTVGEAAAAVKAGARAKGVPDTPLRDTGHLVDSVNYIVDKS